MHCFICFCVSHRVNELNALLCPEQINNKSIPFIPEVHWKGISKYFMTFTESLHCFIFLRGLADLWQINRHFVAWLLFLMAFLWISSNIYEEMVCNGIVCEKQTNTYNVLGVGNKIYFYDISWFSWYYMICQDM